MRLNDKQLDVINNGYGRCLVIASAGSGKSTVLTKRIEFLLDSGESPESILAITFTNKAANDLKRKIEASVKHDAALLNTGTFHSACAKILRSYGHLIGLRTDFTIADEEDAFLIMKKTVTDLEGDVPDDRARQALHVVSYFTNNGITPRVGSNYEAIYQHYLGNLQQANTLDFDGLIYYTVKLLEFQKVVHFKFVLVDEFQDTNVLQMRLVDLLSEEYNNLLVFADDWQSIYRFRYAHIENVIELDQDPKVRKFILDMNYRNTQTIVNVSNSLIQNNKTKVEKVVKTENTIGERILLLHSYNNLREAHAVGQLVRQWDKEEIAILCRTNSQMRDIEGGLIRAGVVFTVANGDSIFSYSKVKDILGYLKFIENPNDIFSLQRILNVPKRGIGQKNMNIILEELQRSDDYLNGLKELKTTKKIAENLKLFVKVIEVCRRHKDDIKEVINILVETFQFNDKSDENSIVYDFIEIIDRLEDKKTVAEFLEMCYLYTEEDNSNSRVKVMTIHASKGLEFDTVLIPGVEEGIIPHYNAVNDTLVEEERRLFYVALTRARKKVVLSLCSQRIVFDKVSDAKPSRFLKELPKELLSRIYV